MDIATKFASGQ
jgi:hypothetical protein